MDKIEEIIEHIDDIYSYYRHSRSFVPYLNPKLVGKNESPPFNINRNVTVTVIFNEPLTKDFILLNNQIAHYLNQNFLIRLYALLDYHQVVSEKEKINKDLPGADEVDILRRLRRLFSHTSGKYNPSNNEHLELVQRIISFFNLSITEPNDFPISIDKVIEPIVIKTKEYIKAKFQTKNVK